jgi:putative flippase GtrA
MKQLALFCAVGVGSTIIDFAVYNVFIAKFNWSRLKSNIISMSAGLSFAFACNAAFVFPSNADSLQVYLVKFIASNLFSMYVVQSSFIYVSTRAWSAEVLEFVDWLKKTGCFFSFSAAVLARNIVKMGGTALSLICNFLLYKYFVFS